MPLPIVAGIAGAVVGGTKLLVSALNSDGLTKALTAYYCPFCRKEVDRKDLIEKRDVVIENETYDITKCPKCKHIVKSQLTRARH